MGREHQCTAQFETSLIFRVQVGLYVVKKIQKVPHNYTLSGELGHFPLCVIQKEFGGGGGGGGGHR